MRIHFYLFPILVLAHAHHHLRPGRPLILPIHLSVAMSSYDHFCILQHIHSLAFPYVSSSAVLPSAEGCAMCSQRRAIFFMRRTSHSPPARRPGPCAFPLFSVLTTRGLEHSVDIAPPMVISRTTDSGSDGRTPEMRNEGVGDSPSHTRGFIRSYLTDLI